MVLDNVTSKTIGIASQDTNFSGCQSVSTEVQKPRESQLGNSKSFGLNVDESPKKSTSPMGQDCQVGNVKLEKRYYVDSEVIQKEAADCFTRSKKGITAAYLVNEGTCSNKQHASRALRHCMEKGLIFKPTSKRPPTYYATSQQFEVNDHLNPRNVKLNPTGVTGNFRFNYLESTTGYVNKKHADKIPSSLADLTSAKADNLQDVMKSLGFVPHYIHNIRLGILVPSGVYEDLKIPADKYNKSKIFTTRIGQRGIRLDINEASLTLTIACSEYPLPIQTEENIDELLVFLGLIRLIILKTLVMQDHFLQPTKEWILLQCDVNQDIPITTKAQLTMCKEVQITVAARTFRRYVKNMEGKPVYRLEEAITPKRPIIESVKAIRAGFENQVIN